MVRLPPDFQSAVDPIDANPFALHDPRHAVWAAATRVAEEEVHRKHSETVLAEPTDVRGWVDYYTGRTVPALDAWARRGLSTLSSELDVQSYDQWLHLYLNSWLDELTLYFEWREPPFPADVVLLGVRARIVHRAEFWKAEARRRLRETEAGAREAAATASTVTPELIARRKALVRRFRKEADLTVPQFSRQVGMSDTAIKGIINEDRSRFSADKQQRLLQELGITHEDWYRT